MTPHKREVGLIAYRRDLIERVQDIVREEEPGSHWLSHFYFAKRVLGEPTHVAGELARGYRHRALTRDECDGLLDDWIEDRSLFINAGMEVSA